MSAPAKYPRLANIRRVWRAVSARPDASVRELAQSCAVAPSTVRSALQALQHAGYIAQTAHAARARRVLVPFVEVRA